MRRLRLYLFAATTALGLIGAVPSFAQYQGPVGGGGGRAGDDQEQDDARRKKRESEFGSGNAALPALKNAGPCPFVKSLYDAARTIQFKDNVEASADVVYSGEIEDITSACAYKGAEPIRLRMQVLFSLGRGPQATSSHTVYRYWVAVTDRNHAVLDKAWFDLPITFPAGQDHVNYVETLDNLTIPRADSKVSGANFEVLLGFEVTPQMAAFNRDGKRFRANAGQTEVSASKP